MDCAGRPGRSWRLGAGEEGAQIAWEAGPSESSRIPADDGGVWRLEPAMAREKKVSELPGISQTAVVGLNRMGVLTAAELMAADFERVAYVLEDYNEAARLVREARKAVDGKRVRSGDPGPMPPAPLASGIVTPPAKPAMKVSEWARSVAAGAPTGKANRPGGHPGPASAAAGSAVVGTALAMAAESAMGDEGDGWRVVLRRRLSAVTTLLDHRGTEAEVAAALLLEAIEEGEVGAEMGGEATSKMGAEVERILEECISLRTVPVLPNGKIPRYYLEMARNAGLPSRRVCAACLLAAFEHEPSAPGPELTRLGEALLAGPGDELLRKLEALLEGMKRAAA
jgi:hypothetical protein